MEPSHEEYYARPGCGTPTEGIVMDSGSPLTESGRRQTKIFPRQLIITPRLPIGDEVKSAYITDYLWTKARASNNQRVVILSEFFGEIHRTVGQLIMSPENGHFAIYDLATNARVVHATPYTLKISTYKQPDRLTIAYTKDAPSVTSVLGTFALPNPDFRAKVSHCETTFLDFIPYDILVTWLPDPVYTETLPVKNGDVKYGHLCDRRKEFGFTSIRNTKLFLPKFALEYPDVVFEDVLHLQFRTRVSGAVAITQRTLDTHFSREQANTSEYLNWAKARPFTVALVIMTSIDEVMAQEFPFGGHTVCVAIEMSDDKSDCTVYIVEPNGLPSFFSNFIRDRFTLAASEHPDIQRIKFDANRFDIHTHMRERMERIRDRYPEAYRSRLISGRCNVWSTLFLANIARHHRVMKPFDIVREMKRMSPEAVYQVYSLFALYAQQLGDGNVDTVSSDIVVKPEPWIPDDDRAEHGVEVIDLIDDYDAHKRRMSAGGSEEEKEPKRLNLNQTPPAMRRP